VTGRTSGAVAVVDVVPHEGAEPQRQDFRVRAGFGGGRNEVLIPLVTPAAAATRVSVTASSFSGREVRLEDVRVELRVLVDPRTRVEPTVSQDVEAKRFAFAAGTRVPVQGAFVVRLGAEEAREGSLTATLHFGDDGAAPVTFRCGDGADLIVLGLDRWAGRELDAVTVQGPGISASSGVVEAFLAGRVDR